MGRLYPGDVIKYLNWFKDERMWTPFGRFYQAVGVADITTTSTTAFDIKFRSGQKDRSDLTGLIVPAGAVIQRVALRIPSPATGQTLIATNGDRLKLATAVGATGTQAFNATASTAYVASSVAASTTFAAEQKKFEVHPFQGSATPAAADFSVALSGNTTFRLFNDNGTTGTGSGVRVSTGTLQVICEVCWWQSADVPTVEEIAGRPTTA